jgi:hypothetical protein
MFGSGHKYVHHKDIFHALHSHTKYHHEHQHEHHREEGKGVGTGQRRIGGKIKPLKFSF